MSQDKMMSKPVAKAALGRAALLATTLIWGTSFVILKNMLDNISTFYMLAIRFTGASIIMLIAGVRQIKQLDMRYLKNGSVMGVCLFFAYVLQTYGLIYTTPGKNAFLTASYCIMVPFLHWFISKKRPGKQNIAAAIICVTGIGLVSLQNDFTVGIGELLTTCCGLFYALHIIYTAKYAGGCNVALLNMVQFAVVAAASWVLALISGPMHSALYPETVLGIVYLCVMCTACCFFLQTYGQKHTPPSQASVILTLESVFGVLISVLFYGETLSLRLIFGFALIFIAIMISEGVFTLKCTVRTKS